MPDDKPNPPGCICRYIHPSDPMCKVELPVVCAICGSRHRSVLPKGIGDLTQGNECAATSYLRDGVVVVVCHYGSDLDMNLYRWDEGVAGLDPICDECILARVRSGAMVLIAEHVL
jgi:hypothetical protein